MDGTSSDSFLNGTHYGPAPMSVVLRDYPDIVICLINGCYDIFSPITPNGVRNFQITVNTQNIKKKFLVCEEDFDICKSLAVLFSANKFSPGPASAFSSEPIQDFRARIAARLQVLFSGRG